VIHQRECGYSIPAGTVRSQDRMRDMAALFAVSNNLLRGNIPLPGVLFVEQY